MTIGPVLSFGEFRLDPSSGRVYRGDATVPLTPKAFSLLQFLAATPDRLISKQELLDVVWPNVFVGDAVLKSTIRELRKVLGDDAETPQYIETAHRRGYRFIAPVTAEEPAAAADARTAALAAIAVPRVHYARSGHVNIAYQVLGDGPIDLVFVMGWVSHLEYFWNEPHFARFLTRLAKFSRLILFDKRGTGLSDAVPVSQLPTLEQRLDDVRAVMDAVGSTHAALLGVSEGGPLCSLFAATYPEKTDALIMFGSYARRMRDDDYPWGPNRAERDAFLKTILDEWGGPVGIDVRAPSMINDASFRAWWSSYLRMGASPGAAVALTKMNAEIDVRDVLPSIRVPTLVLHREGDQCLKVEEGRYLASKIPGATYVELPGSDHLPFLGDQDAIVAEIEQFLQRTHDRSPAELVLASILTIRSGARPDDVEHLRQVFEREVGWARGRVIAAGADRLVAAFDGPGRAVRCARTVVTIAARSRIPVKAGVHVGECDLAVGRGPIFDTSAALADGAGDGDVAVSRTVVDLVPGSGLEFDTRGSYRILTAR